MLVDHLITTAQAHHAATGGLNPQWADWYAERLVDEVNDALNTEVSIDDLAAWLGEADRRYQEESPEMSWPKAYAEWLLEPQSP